MVEAFMSGKVYWENALGMPYACSGRSLLSEPAAAIATFLDDVASRSINTSFKQLGIDRAVRAAFVAAQAADAV